MPFNTKPKDEIRGVVWGGKADIAVLTFDYVWSRETHAVFTLQGLPFTGTVYDLLSATILYSDPKSEPPIPAIVNPVSKEMLGKILLWNVPPFKNDPIEMSIGGRAMIFFNIRKIKPTMPKDEKIFSFLVNCPAGSSRTMPGIIYYMWGDVFGASSFEENEEHPYSTGDPFSPYDPWDPRSTMVIPRAFGDPGTRSIYLARMGTQYHSHDSAFTTTIKDSLGYELQLHSYRDRKDFPQVDAKPKWTLDAPPEFKGSAAVSANQTGNSMPGRLVRFQINTETLQCTVT